MKSQLIGKDPDAEKDRRQEKKGDMSQGLQRVGHYLATEQDSCIFLHIEEHLNHYLEMAGFLCMISYLLMFNLMDGFPTHPPTAKKSHIYPPLRAKLFPGLSFCVVRRSEKTPGSKCSSTSGLSPRGHLERQAEFHASTHDEA